MATARARLLHRIGIAEGGAHFPQGADRRACLQTDCL